MPLRPTLGRTPSLPPTRHRSAPSCHRVRDRPRGRSFLAATTAPHGPRQGAALLTRQDMGRARVGAEAEPARRGGSSRTCSRRRRCRARPTDKSHKKNGAYASPRVRRRASDIDQRRHKSVERGQRPRPCSRPVVGRRATRPGPRQGLLTTCFGRARRRSTTACSNGERRPRAGREHLVIKVTVAFVYAIEPTKARSGKKKLNKREQKDARGPRPIISRRSSVR